MNTETVPEASGEQVVVLPEHTKNWEVLDRPYLEDTVRFAMQVGKLDSLTDCLDRLQAIADNTNAKVTLGRDLAPHSFGFAINRETGCVINGGLIFHGSHDGGGNGSAPTYSVSMSPVDGWSIHT